MTATREADTVVVSSFLPGEEPFKSDVYAVLGVECVSEFSYWQGVSSVWQKGLTVVNVEHDMEFSDDLVAGLLDCPHDLCAYAYSVYPTALGRYIYCATRDRITDEEFDQGKRPGWITGPADEWADWSSIGFCKIAPAAQTAPLDKMFWQWFEHCINRVTTATVQQGSLAIRRRWHIHWPEVQHHHDYHGLHGDPVPDHLW